MPWDGTGVLLCHNQPYELNSWVLSPPSSILPTWKGWNTSLILQTKSSILGQRCQQMYLNSQDINIISHFQKSVSGPILLFHFINSQRQWKTKQMSLIIIFCLSMLWEEIRGRERRKRWKNPWHKWVFSLHFETMLFLPASVLLSLDTEQTQTLHF